MRVLILTQYFTPEITAAPLRLHPFAKGLADRGHEVTVISETPSHPGGTVLPGYGGRIVDRRRLDGFRQLYVATYASPRRTAVRRLSSYASYAGTALVTASLMRRPDVVLASSPPLSVAAAGALTSRRFRIPWVMDVRDLWPEVAGALGQVTSSRLLRAATGLERWLYRDASAVTTVTEPFVAHIERIRARPGVHLLPNGTTREWLDASRLEVERADLDLGEDQFLLTYAGNVGLSQGIEVAIEAVRRAGPRFHLLVLGDGASRLALEALAAKDAPGQVTFRGPVPGSEARRYLRASDALLVSLSDSPELGKTIPIKLYDYCAVGRPVIVSAPGEAARLACEEGIAIATQPGDPGSLADAISILESDPSVGAANTARARAFAASHIRDDLIEPLEAVLADVRRR